MPKESRRRKKDPRKPKRGKSAFLLFSQYTRPTVVAEMPDLAFPDIAREVARRWKLIDGDEKAVRGAVTASCCAVALPCQVQSLTHLGLSLPSAVCGLCNWPARVSPAPEA